MVNSETFRIEIKNEIKLYIILMFVAICIRTFFFDSIVIIWIINFIGLFFIFRHRLRKVEKAWAYCIIFFLMISLSTFLVNIKYLENDIKGIGTNVNLLVTPTYIILLGLYYKERPFSDDSIWSIFNIISIIGLVSVAFAWITGYRDIISVIYGRMNAYLAKGSGLFYGKNIYGAFISLSGSVDLFLYNLTKKNKYIVLYIIKLFAVMVSFSRAALLHAAVFLIVYLWFNKKRAKREWILLFLTAIVIVVVVLLNRDILNAFTNTIIRFEAGDAGRSNERIRSLNAIDNNILVIIFGLGFPGLGMLSLDIDNTYFYLFFTGGILKCVFFIFGFFFFIHNSFRIYKYNKSLTCFCVGMALSYYVYAFYESVCIFELGFLNYIFTLLIFLIPSGYRVSNENKI